MGQGDGRGDKESGDEDAALAANQSWINFETHDQPLADACSVIDASGPTRSCSPRDHETHGHQAKPARASARPTGILEIRIVHVCDDFVTNLGNGGRARPCAGRPAEGPAGPPLVAATSTVRNLPANVESRCTLHS